MLIADSGFFEHDNNWGVVWNAWTKSQPENEETGTCKQRPIYIVWNEGATG